MASLKNFDLNLSLDQHLSFDLNEVPNLNIQKDKEDDDVVAGNGVGSSVPQTHQDVEASSLISVRSSSDGVQELGLNVGVNEEDSMSMEINIEGSNDDNEDHLPENVDLSQGEIQQTKYRVLSNEERRRIYDALLERSVNEKLKHTTTKEISSLFSVPLKSVQRIWKRVKDTPSDLVVDVSNRRAGKVGRKRVMLDRDCIVNVPLNRRTTLRSLAQALNVNHVTLHNRLKEGLIRRHSNAIKPLLKEDHKIARLKFCISMLDTSSLPHDPKNLGMYMITTICRANYCYASYPNKPNT